MKKIDLRPFGPSITMASQGEEIYKLIKQNLEKEDGVQLNFDGIVSMTTYCAKLIFGTLYSELTPSVFFQQIELLNLSEGMSRTIREGIAAKLSDEQQ